MISESENIKSLFSASKVLEALVTASKTPGALYSVAHTPLISDAGSAHPLAYLFDDMTVILFDGGSMVTYA